MNDNFDQAKNNFLDYLKEKGRASATILAYGNDISQFLKYCQKNQVKSLSEIVRDIIVSYKKHLLDIGYTTKSVARKLNSIKTFFRFLITKKYIKTNPSQDIPHPKYTVNPPRILTKMEYRSLRDVCRNDPRMYAIVELFLQTGIRISELSRLQISDLTDSTVTIGAYESHGGRIIPLNKSAKNAVDTWLEIRPDIPNQSLFITKTGRRFQVRNIRTALNRYFKLADIKDATVNDLRHTFIAHQLKAGTPLTLVSKLAGHKRISTTEKYLEFIKDKNSSDSNALEEL